MRSRYSNGLSTVGRLPVLDEENDCGTTEGQESRHASKNCNQRRNVFLTNDIEASRDVVIAGCCKTVWSYC